VDKEEKDDIAPEMEAKSEAEMPRKRLSTKRKRLLALVVVLVVVAVAIVIGLWGNAPVPYMTVSEVTENASSYLDEEIQIKGTVKNWDSVGKTFELTDGESNLTVSYVTLPEGFNNEKEIVVEGVLKGGSNLILESTKITVGCPSKY